MHLQHTSIQCPTQATHSPDNKHKSASYKQKKQMRQTMQHGFRWQVRGSNVPWESSQHARALAPGCAVRRAITAATVTGDPIIAARGLRKRHADPIYPVRQPPGRTAPRGNGHWVGLTARTGARRWWRRRTGRGGAGPRKVAGRGGVRPRALRLGGGRRQGRPGWRGHATPWPARVWSEGKWEEGMAAGGGWRGFFI